MPFPQHRLPVPHLPTTLGPPLQFCCITLFVLLAVPYLPFAFTLRFNLHFYCRPFIAFVGSCCALPPTLLRACHAPTDVITLLHLYYCLDALYLPAGSPAFFLPSLVFVVVHFEPHTLVVTLLLVLVVYYIPHSDDNIFPSDDLLLLHTCTLPACHSSVVTLLLCGSLAIVPLLTLLPDYPFPSITPMPLYISQILLLPVTFALYPIYHYFVYWFIPTMPVTTPTTYLH